MKNKLNIHLKRNLLLFLSIAILLFIFSKNAIANDSLGIELDEILFFESGNDVPNKQDRNYSNRFRPETQYINIEFSIKNLNYKIADKEYKITFIWKYLNGDEFGRSEATFNVKSDWVTAYMNRGWGFSGNGNWRLGRFTAQILVNGVLFAEKDFFITKFDKDFISLPKENKVIENLQNLPEDINYKILNQYKIEPYPFFNYYYDINFSLNGKDIAYAISHYEHQDATSYSGSSTTRDMYLFRNNKQIVPSYFVLRAEFDENLKNLSYFGLKLTTSDIYEADAYGYYNGLQLYKSVNYIPVDVSPDGKKHTFIMNTMSHLKSSFTWDNAYEFLMINNKKIQAKWLKIARSINITESTSLFEYRTKSIVYIKNPDITYNVVYTAKYKFDKETHYALFNEAERVSPQFDGYISIPYLSPSEKSVAYIVKDKKEWFVMLNDKRITKGYKEIKHEGTFKKIKNEVTFCGQGNNVVYQAKIKGVWYVVKGDEIISEGFSKIESITVNPSGNKIAYKAKTKKKWSVYINKSKISPEFEEIGEGIVFSPDENKLAYAAGNKDSMFVMVNEKQISPNFKIFRKSSMYVGKQPLAITNLTFNKTGDKLAYIVAFDYSGDEIANKMKHSFVMINNIQISPKMYNTSIHSNKPGELFYAGFDIVGLILHHVKIDF